MKIHISPNLEIAGIVILLILVIVPGTDFIMGNHEIIPTTGRTIMRQMEKLPLEHFEYYLFEYQEDGCAFVIHYDNVWTRNSYVKIASPDGIITVSPDGVDIYHTTHVFDRIAGKSKISFLNRAGLEITATFSELTPTQKDFVKAEYAKFKKAKPGIILKLKELVKQQENDRLAKIDKVISSGK
jgi:hypothetical protein